MSESRPNLTSSLSFAGASTASAISRPLKRRLTTTPDLGFFTPAAQSFKPRPYTPNAVPVSSSKPLIPTTRPHSSLTSLAQPIPVMDPSSLDPHAFFLHPPFTAFPDSHNHPEGLSYALMSLNPEWFLDATDFVSTTPNTDGHHAVPYPPQLEPPRGWCPAKKKDLKALGAEGWPEGEEPRLRCTFCRRTYAGVNAKSMWRRHVYEKHKIAMANRREGNDRGRVGRGSNKENRHAYSDRGNYSDEGRRSTKLESMSPQSNYVPLSIMPETYFSSATAAPVAETHTAPAAPSIEQNEFPVPIMSVDFSDAQMAQPSISPPLTPQSLSPKILRRSLSEPISPSPKQTRTIIPQSPYNPLLTPSFRHSPPRLPSDQPWRFPSPSHPLHSRARELCLGMVVRGVASPSTKGVSALDSSPVSILNTPALIHKARGGATESEDTEQFGSSPNALRPSPRTLFGSGTSPFASSSNRFDLGKYPSIEESPLGRLRRKNHNRQKSSLSTFSEIGHDWFSDVSVSSSSGLGSHGLLTPIRLINDDPFGMYSWVKEPRNVNGKEERTSVLSSPGGESPVLRSSQLQEERVEGSQPNLIGLGIGLMAPFTFPDLKYQTDYEGMDNTEDVDFILNLPPSPSEERDEAEVEGALAAAGPPGLPKHALRRAHTFMSGADDQEERNLFEVSAPPMKRRRTVDTRG